MTRLRARRLEVERKRRERLHTTFAQMNAHVNQFQQDFARHMLVMVQQAEAPTTPDVSQEMIPETPEPTVRTVGVTQSP